MTKEIPIDKSELDKAFRYDAVTNILERKLKSGRWKVVNSKPSGNVYSRVGLNGRGIRINRLIWTLVNGNIPENLQVDHIDENKSNNNINNLQLLNNKDNASKSGSGIKPNFVKRLVAYQVQERVSFDGKQHTFYFGCFKDKAEAQKLCDAYKSQFGYGNPYHSVRTKTPEYWRKCMNDFKSQYLNETGLIK